MTSTNGGPGAHCARCQASLTLPDPLRQPVVACPVCQHRMAVAQLAERAHLAEWRAWADSKIDWLDGQLAADDIPAGTAAAAAWQTSYSTPVASSVPMARAPGSGSGPPAAVPPDAAGPSVTPGPPSSSASGGALLLALGALLLVAAGLAFVAFAWSALGPIGQVATLVVVGGACLAATPRVHSRLPGTSTAIGVVGALIVGIAALAARIYGSDVLGAPPALLLSVAIAWGLLAAGVWLRSRVSDVAELSSISGAVLGVLLLATAPIDGALPFDPNWAWWSAIVLIAGSITMLSLSDVLRFASWPPAAAVLLLFGIVAGAGYVVDATSTPADSVESMPLFALLLTAGAVLTLLLTLWQRNHVTLLATDSLVLVSLSSLLGLFIGITDPEQTMWVVTVLVTDALVLGGMTPAMRRVGRPLWGKSNDAPSVNGGLAAGAMVGVSVGLLLAPWQDASSGTLDQQWLATAWPDWRGLAAGLSFALVLVLADLIAHRVASLGPTSAIKPSGLALLSAGAAVVTWLSVSLSGPRSVPYANGSGADDVLLDAIYRQVAIALAITTFALFTMAALRRLPSWTVWLADLVALSAVGFALATLGLTGSLRPEVYGLALSAPTAVASALWWWLESDDNPSTWFTIAPWFTALVLPPAVALLNDVGSQWLGNEPTSAYQIRMVSLLGVGTVASILGARQRWGGLFVPGLLLVLVVLTIQLVQLGQFLPQWASLTVAGTLLIAAGARWEWVRDVSRRSGLWVRALH